MQCLISLPLLMERGLTELTSLACQSYYVCILHCPCPQEVPLGREAKFYKAITKKPIECIQRLLAIEDEADCDSDGSHAVKKRRRGHKQCPALTDRPKRSNQLGKTERPSGACAVGPQSSESEANGDTDEDTLSEETAITVEGMKVSLENRDKQDRKYIRFRVQCPYHFSLAGHKCSTSRTISVSHCRLGDNAPLAFIGVWLEKASSHATGSSHRAFRPSEQEVLDYMVRKGLVNDD